MDDFRFSNEHTLRELGNVPAVLSRSRLWIPTSTDYPSHGDWIEKVFEQLRNGRKRAMIAYQGGTPIGVCIYQRHPNKPGAIEIKNLSVVPDSQGRLVGAFLLRNSEIEGTENDFPECKVLVGDTKITNSHMIKFLINQGYVPTSMSYLYETGTNPDLTLTKTLSY